MSMDFDNEELTEFIQNELKMFKPLQKREEDTIRCLSLAAGFLWRAVTLHSRRHKDRA